MMRTWLVGLFIIMVPVRLAAQDGLTVEAATKQILLKGYTRSQVTATISSEVGGKVVQINYEVGDTIGNAPFFRIDPTFIDFELQGARQSILELQIALKRSQSRSAYLEKEFERIDRLWRENSTAETQRDKAAEDLTQARLETASIEVRLSEMRIRLAELEERKRRHSIRAPQGWVVVRKMVETGEIIAVNTPLATVSDYRRLVIPLFVSGKELQAVERLGSRFDALLEGRPVRAAIYWINPEFDEKTRKLAIKLILEDYSGERRGGLQFELPLEIATEGLRVPRAAVVDRYENPRVRIKNTGESVQVLILGESDGYFVIDEHPKLAPGTPLAPGLR
jgi:multidrug efflux pump subunit AcrA (membrane-fusion protein)